MVSCVNFCVTQIWREPCILTVNPDHMVHHDNSRRKYFSESVVSVVNVWYWMKKTSELAWKSNHIPIQSKPNWLQIVLLLELEVKYDFLSLWSILTNYWYRLGMHDVGNFILSDIDMKPNCLNCLNKCSINTIQCSRQWYTPAIDVAQGFRKEGSSLCSFTQPS